MAAWGARAARRAGRWVRREPGEGGRERGTGDAEVCMEGLLAERGCGGGEGDARGARSEGGNDEVPVG